MLKLIVGAAVTAASLVLAPSALADPDPHIPDANAGWCPGGDFRERISGGSRYCLGIEYPDGTFYSQGRGHSTAPFGPGYWVNTIHCSHWTDSKTVWWTSGNGSCGGGPGQIDR